MNITGFALFGAKPAFEQPVPFGQLYFPTWDRYEAAMRGIFDRQYYNNNGPLHQQLDEKLRDFFVVNHVICVHNATLGLMMLADAMGLSGKVIMPAFTFAASAQSLTWAGLEPVFCDVDPITHHIDPDRVKALIGNGVSAIMGVNLLGGACDQGALAAVAEANGIQVYFDSAHAFGCEAGGVKIGNFGRAEVFSFHSDNIINAAEGGCICTSDDELAARLRSIRPSYGPDIPVNILRVANARMSEAQAAAALMGLEDFQANRANNEKLFHLYEKFLVEIPGLRLVRPGGVSLSNYQHLVCVVDEAEFGMGRDLLIKLLRAENILAKRLFYPGLHRSIPYVNALPQYGETLPNTDRLCARSVQFPIGALVSAPDVERICGILLMAHQNAGEILARHAK
ncbi:MAG: DegT/DnrJ/EryC1/StrS family aminotransferase [Actinomycetota bacterium]|nr:DegT/DnrJ/EryC1/StrS family aminotransferase [Actinomycetota bacterium]